MGNAMSTKDLKQKLSQHIDAARAKLDALKKDLSSMHDEDMEALQARREEIDKRIEEQQAKAQKLQADMDSWKKEKVAHTEDAISSWRKKRELKKLENRADRAEEYAMDLVITAAYDFEQAEQAVLDALAARFDADTASSSPA
jgi:chromosome segregation ATPase